MDVQSNRFLVFEKVLSSIIVLLTFFLFTVLTLVVGQSDEAKYANTQKIVVYKDDVAALEAVKGLDPKEVFDYQDFQVFIFDETEDSELESFTQETLVEDMNKILLRNRTIDTTQQVQSPSEAFVAIPTTGNQLYLVQFAAPVKDEWLEEITSLGAVKILSYIPSNAYLVWIDNSVLSDLLSLYDSQAYLQWFGPYQTFDRVDPDIHASFEAFAVPTDSPEGVKVTVQFVNHPDVEDSIDMVKQAAQEILQDAWVVGPYKNLRVVILQDELNNIAILPDVINVELWVEPELFGERQGQILANQLNSAGSEPTGPGYLAWLQNLGFNETFDFVVNVTDSGLDRGSTTAANLHPDFLDADGNSRIAYVQQVRGTIIDTSPSSNVDIGGHGTIDHAIVGGFNNGNNSAFHDSDGYHFGLGIAPFVRLGSSRIFNPSFSPSFTFPNHTELTNAAYSKGAVISSNSWGSVIGNGRYDIVSQEYDALVRDARPTTASDGGKVGNQEMIIVWAAGNKGSNRRTLGDRGATAKNTLVVGASENFYQAGTDGCSIANSGADDARDIIDFSSRGPNADNRYGPHIMGPGTHIQGATSQSPNYEGNGVCNGFFPFGQKLYAWSSGTSHSTPAVAGAAALLRQWFLNKDREAPSPAMTKAYLMNSATYLTGAGANDRLPSNNQGMGRLNLERAFDAAPRILVDQIELFSGVGESHVIEGTVADSDQPFRVTLAWTDAPGSTIGNAWVNDLDLRVTLNGNAGSVTYLGNVFNKDLSQPGGIKDHRNNVESVWLPAGTSGNFTVRVTASNIPGDGVPNNNDVTDQDFALVVYNAVESSLPTPLPPEIKNFTATPNTVNEGESSTLSWEVAGTEPITLTINQGIGGVTGTSTRVSPINTITYELTASNDVGITSRGLTIVVTDKCKDPADFWIWWQCLFSF